MSRDRRDSPPRALSGDEQSAAGPVGTNASRASAAPSQETGGDPVPTTTLASTGAILVTDRALDQWMRGMAYDGARSGHVLDLARRQLLALAADARPVDRECTPERWRSRRRTHDLDVSLLVERATPIEGLPPIVVVIAAEARSYARSAGGGRKRRERGR